MKKKLLYLLTLAMLLTACSAPQPTPSESTSDDHVTSESTTESESESESIEESESLSESESEQPSETESEVPVESESEEPSESEQPSESESENVVVSTTVSKSSFNSTSGDLDSVISYKCYKGGGTSDPAIYDNIIRLYQGSHGGYIVLTAKDGYTITSATVGSAMSTTVGYTIGNQSSPTNGGSLSANDKFTLNNLDCGQVGFYCLGTSKSARLYVNYLSVTYLGKAPGGNGGNGGNTSESEPPVTSESEPPVTSESEPPITSESEPPVSSESEYTGPGWGGKQTPDYPSTYYDSCKGKSGTNLKNQLASFNQPKSKSYNWSRYEAADEAEGAPNYVLCLYTRHNIPKNNHVGSYSWDTWNREHIWTQSKYPNSDTDNHNIFACEGQINNVRGSLKFGDVANTDTNRVSVHGHQTDCYKASSLFEPCDAAKGEVARSVMYGAIYYGYSLSEMLDINLALKWNEEFPVSNREIYRNNTVNDLQGNRNPFVDHPEYARLIWG